MSCGFGDAPGEAFGFAEFAVGEVVAFVPLQVAVVLPHLGYVALVLTAAEQGSGFATEVTPTVPLVGAAMVCVPWAE